MIDQPVQASIPHQPRKSPGCLIVIGFFIALAILVMIGIAVRFINGAPLQSNQVRIERADFADAWPFTVEQGILQCDNRGDGRLEIAFLHDGKLYAINGTAKSNTARYFDANQILADGTSGSGLKKNTQPIVDRGLDLCNA